MRRILVGALVPAIAGLAACSVASAENRRTELVSVGPGGTNATAALEAVSKDGTKAFLMTGDELVPEDNDDLCEREAFPGHPLPPTPCIDLYVRDLATGTTQLVSTGPTGGSGHFDARLPLYSRLAISDDGNRVFFETAEPLVSTDTDTKVDVYERDLATQTTKLISTGPLDQGRADATFTGASADGSRAFFITNERLVAADGDAQQDGYLREGDTTTLLTTGPTGGDGPWPAGAGPASTDGTRVLLGGRENLVAEDTDNCPSSMPGPCADVYERDLTTGSLELVTTGPHGNQNNYTVQLWGSSTDGKRVIFSTAEPLVDDDVEANCPSHDGLGEVGCVDLYERDLSTQTTKLLSIGPRRSGADGKSTNDDAFFDYVSPDAGRVLFHTREQLVDADTDSSSDLYERAGGTTTLLSGSPGVGSTGGSSAYAGSSRDGSVVYVSTPDALVPDDTDGRYDDYERSGGQFKLATTGPAGGNGAFDASTVYQASSDGRRFFFYTQEQLVPEDTNGTTDIYERFDGTTTLISKGPTGTGANQVSPTVRVDEAGRNVFFTSPARLVAADTDDSGDVYVSMSIPNEPPACDAVEPSRPLLWPPNRTLRTMTLSGATDPDGDPPTLEITEVTQDEPVGSSPDAQHAPGADAVRLRAERDQRGDGRVYRIAFKATDDQGDSCQGVATVTVPRHRGTVAVDSAPPSYDSFGS